MNTNRFHSVVIPLVGTLNDDDIASPVFYIDETGARQEKLVETPAIQIRKERMKHYLRDLDVRFKDHEPLFLYAAFVTHNNRPIDATNVLDLIQNAGSKVIWNDDSQFVDVHCRRCVHPRLRPEHEFTVVYVGTVGKASIGKMSLSTGRLQKIASDFGKKYSLAKCMEEQFDLTERAGYSLKGFWRDDRFLKILALRPAYIKWLSDQGDAVTNSQEDCQTETETDSFDTL